MTKTRTGLRTDRVIREINGISALVRSATDRAGGLRPAARICGVSPNTIRHAGNGDAKPSTLARIELQLTRAGYMEADLTAGLPRDWAQESLIPLHEAVLESPLCAQAYHDWVGSGGQWPVDDASNDEAYSALLARRASVILKTNGEYAIRFYGKALRMTYHPDACDKAETIAALLSVTARTRARYALCSRALAPVAALSRFAVNDQDLPVPCIVVTFPWWQPNGTLLLTSISERAVA